MIKRLKKFNKNIRVTAVYLLLTSLSLHILVIHGMFNSTVICFEEDGTTNIEYTFDGASCAAHTNILSDDYEFVKEDKETECKDISLAELHDSDEQFLIKKHDKTINKIQIAAAVSIYTAVNEQYPAVYSSPIEDTSPSLTQFKTVSLII